MLLFIGQMKIYNYEASFDFSSISDVFGYITVNKCLKILGNDPNFGIKWANNLYEKNYGTMSLLVSYGYSMDDIVLDLKRRDSKILTKENAEQFLNQMAEFEISFKDLQFYFLESVTELDDSWYYDFQPSLFIDFDNNSLYS